MISLAPWILLAASLQSTPPAPLFAPATEGIVIPAHTAGDEWSYLNLVEDYLRVTGQQFSYSAEAREDLTGTHSKFLSAVEVPPQAVQHVFEALLAEQHFALVPDRSGHAAKIHTLMSLSLMGEMRSSRGIALPIALEVLSTFENHPAVLIECLVPTGAIEARLLANAVRGTHSDAGVNALVPLANSNALLVRGRGPTVAAYVSSWQRPAGLALIEENGLRPEDVSLDSGWPLRVPDKDSGVSLLDLLRAFEIQTGVHFAIGSEQRIQLEGLRPAAGLPESLAADQVQEFLESLLFLHGFSLHVYRVEEPKIMAVVSPLFRDSQQRWLPNRIDPSTVEEWVRHPAVHIRTEFSTGGIEARLLSNAFRGYVTDAGTEFYLPMGGANWLAAGGFGPMLASRKSFIEQAAKYVVEVPDEQTQEEPAEAPSPGGGFNPLGNR